MPSNNNRSNRYQTSGVRRCRSEIEAMQNRALELRNTTNMTLRQIAIECGYVHPATGEPRPQSADMAIRAARTRQGRSTVSQQATVIANTAISSVSRRAINGMPSNRTFGVEIEFFGTTAQSAINALANVGIRASFEGYSHVVMADWKIVTDVSVSSQGTGTGRGLELVSPILRGQAGLESLEKALSALRTAGAKVDKSCGIHVHVGMDGLVGAQLMQVIDLYHANQNHIDYLVSRSRRNTSYAKHFTNASLTSGYSAQVFNALRIARTATATANNRRNTGNADRYYVVNVSAYAKYGTLEFRQHQGSLNGKKVGAWVQFILALVEKATADNVTTQFATADEMLGSMNLRRPVQTYLKGRHASLVAGGRA